MVMMIRSGACPDILNGAPKKKTKNKQTKKQKNKKTKKTHSELLKRKAQSKTF